MVNLRRSHFSGSFLHSPLCRITFARNKELDPSPNVIDWIGVFNNYCALQGTQFQSFQWVGLVLGIPQMIATLYIVGVRFPTTRLDDNVYLQKVPGDYFLKDGYQPSTNVRCAVSNFDPRLYNDRVVLQASRAQAVVGLTQFLFTIYAWIIIVLVVFVFKGCCGKFSEKLRSRMVWSRIAWLTLMLTAVAMLGVEFRYVSQDIVNPPPMFWDTNCGVLSIFMSGKNAFYDIKILQVQRIFRSLFGVA
ncbi:hypothetical protein Hypma_001981 [Hypsizygus marmoreus]|uniref:Uncharacterized protein n=1 Tax=Hypsizygus marmoreus TaxID=39966 RepID=A0A369J539_HYPMA|nr:hypothetical protein Hypma_001981 [Hypsizygus marmoreus]